MRLTSRAGRARPAAVQQLELVDDGFMHGGGQIGLERYLRADSALDRRLVLFGPGRLADTARAHGVPVEVVQSGHRRSALPLVLLRRTWRALRARREGTVVVANSFTAAMVVAATVKNGARYVYYMREDLSPEWISGLKRFVATRIALPRFDGFLANSGWTGDTLPVSLRSRPLAVAFPLCGVVEDAPTAPGSADPQAGLRILSLSRITRWKGVDVVADATRLLAEGTSASISLTLAGTVSAGDREYLADVLARTGPNVQVEFLGHVDDISPLLLSHDVLVLASRHPEPFGQVMIQALAAGLTVIATGAGGPAEVLADEPLATLVPPEDPGAIVTALHRLIDRPVTPEARAASAASVRSRYSDAQLSRQFEEAVRTVAG